MYKILIADDSNFQRKLIKNVIEESGYIVFEAKNGVECLSLYDDIKPDCILLDLLMPEKTGNQVLAELKEIKNIIPVIVISADVQQSTRDEVESLGAFAFLNKPPKKEELIKVIAEAIKNKTI